MTTYASPTGGLSGGKSFGCSHTCDSGLTLPPVISAQKGQVATPSRRFMRCGALTRYWRKIGFQTKGVRACSIKVQVSFLTRVAGLKTSFLTQLIWDLCCIIPAGE